MAILDQYLWFSYGLLCGILLLVAFLNQRIKSFPVFFCLLGWYFVAFLVEFTVKDGSDAVWIWSMLLMNGVSCPLEIAVLYAVARDLFFSHPALTTHLKPLPRYVLAVLILSSTILAALTPTPSRVMARRMLMRIWFAQDCVEVGLLVSLVLLAGTLGISWKRLQAGVVLGWGISSSVSILAMLLLSRLGRPFMLSADVLHQVGFNICALLWLRYILYPEQARRCAVTSLPVGLNLNDEAEKLQVILRGQF